LVLPSNAIFTVLSGIALKTDEFRTAFQEVYVNLFVQVFSFGVDSVIVFGVSKALLAAGALSKPLSDGLVVCSTLSMSINMVQVLTKTAGGDEASAIFNAVGGNTIGVFLSPMLVLGYVGVTADVALGTVFYQLALRVVAPILVGQSMRQIFPCIVTWYTSHKNWFKRAQIWSLAYIIYTVFCTTFASDDDSVTGLNIAVMVIVVFFCVIGLMILAWVAMRILFRDKPTFRVMGLFGCTHKTMAIGVPLIGTIYKGDPNIGLITLPLLIWHTMNLIVGIFLTARLAAWVDKEEKRISGLVSETELPVDVENSQCTLDHLQTDATKTLDRGVEDGSSKGGAISESRITLEGQFDEESL
jgi:solute carrier family 10 (sodium/bile acid cotransporter), member 7